VGYETEAVTLDEQLVHGRVRDAVTLGRERPAAGMRDDLADEATVN